LLDACVDWRLSRAIIGHEVKTAHQMGWGALKNGALLASADGSFHVFVTVDQGIPFQQNVQTPNIAVVILQAKTKRLADLLQLVPGLLMAIDSAKSGTVKLVRS
jgi:hypothetical protein